MRWPLATLFLALLISAPARADKPIYVSEPCTTHRHHSHHWCKEPPRASIVESVAIRRLGIRPESAEERAERARERARERELSEARERAAERELAIVQQLAGQFAKDSLADILTIGKRIEALEKRFERTLNILETQQKTMENLNQRLDKLETDGKSVMRFKLQAVPTQASYKR